MLLREAGVSYTFDPAEATGMEEYTYCVKTFKNDVLVNTKRLRVYTNHYNILPLLNHWSRTLAVTSSCGLYYRYFLEKIQ